MKRLTKEYKNTCLSSSTLLIDDIVDNIDNALPEEFTPRDLINEFKKSTPEEKQRILICF